MARRSGRAAAALAWSAAVQRRRLGAQGLVAAPSTRHPGRCAWTAEQRRRRLSPRGLRHDGARCRLAAVTTAGTGWRSRERRALLLLLLASAAVRIALVLGGGQSFFPDEGRFGRSILMLLRLRDGDIAAAAEMGLDPEHTGWVHVGAAPALAQGLYLVWRGAPLESRASWTRTLWLPALFLSLVSVALIGLVHALARRVGAPPDEALLAALLAACSTSLFYPARHLQPYDAALALALAALWLALSPAPRLATSLGCGLLAGASFLTYNGSWMLAGGVVAVAAMRAGPWWARARRAVALGIGAASPVVLVVALDRLLLEGAYIREARSFARTVTQGAFTEGWRLPWEYLWEAEKALLAGLLAALALAVHRLARCGDPGERARGGLWVGAVLGIYAALAVSSTLLQTFTVYGRLVRPLIPFLCLAAAWALAPRLRRAPPAARAALGAMLLAHTGAQFAVPLRLVFPDQAQRQVAARFGPMAERASVLGPPAPPRPPGAPPGTWLLNATYLYPLLGPAEEVPTGDVLWRTAHPFQYRPYQFEGFTPAERSLLREVDVSVRVVREAVEER